MNPLRKAPPKRGFTIHMHVGGTPRALSTFEPGGRFEDRDLWRDFFCAGHASLVFRHACKMGLEGIVSKRLGSRYRSGRSPDWLKFKNPAPAVKREAEEDWR